MHAAALTWTSPRFEAFDTGRMVAGSEDAPADASASGTAPTSDPGEPMRVKTPETPAEPPRRTLVVESIDSPAVAVLRAEALAARANGNGNTPASEAGTSDADRGDTETTNCDPSVAGGPDGIAGPVNGRDADPEPTPPPGPPSPRSSTISAGWPAGADRRPRRIGRTHLAGGRPIARLAAAHLRPPSRPRQLRRPALGPGHEIVPRPRNGRSRRRARAQRRAARIGLCLRRQRSAAAAGGRGRLWVKQLRRD